MSVVTRFPPSPTGFMHIGNARTALFNYIFARHHGGQFLVRIEDTDRKRHSEEAVDIILKGLEWLQLDYDGEVTSQFSNQARHKDIAHQLVENGQAYRCYCTPEELEDMRQHARAEGKAVFYDRRWRDQDSKNAPNDVDPVIRIKAPLEGSITIQDDVQGEVTVQASQLDDFIILRSDGTPTYMLSVVVDDHDMGVTHIIRGDDHLNNAFRQKVIYDSMGWDIPSMAHLPLIHGPDGGKFSKRHGAQSVEEYREMGYLSEAMNNYLLRLGWGHGDDEIISREQAIEWFSLEGVGKSAAKFDFSKLENLNSHYIQEKKVKDLITSALPFYKEHYGVELSQNVQNRIIALGDELKSRAKTLLQFVDESVFFAQDVPLDIDEDAQKKLDQTGLEYLQKALESFQSLEDFTAETVKQTCYDLADGKLGKIGMPLRAAITGKMQSPSIFDACAILGQKETCKRIEEVLKRLG